MCVLGCLGRYTSSQGYSVFHNGCRFDKESPASLVCHILINLVIFQITTMLALGKRLWLLLGQLGVYKTLLQATLLLNCLVVGLTSRLMTELPLLEKVTLVLS